MPPLNYRHDFHAGNFADLVKHALLLEAFRALAADPSPLTILDTHAGAGLYDLEGEAARRSGEAVAIQRLMADPAAPAAFDALKAAVRAANPGGGVRFYPGSPALALGVMRKADQFVGCELRPDDHARLARLVRDTGKKGQALARDGYEVLAEPFPADRRRLVLIDPPFERGDEYRRLLSGLAALFRRGGEPVAAVWLPLKDLETLDGFLRGLEAMGPPPTLVVQARLRTLDDPTRLNGSVMVMIGAADLSETAGAVCHWVVASLGDTGGEARIERL